MTEPFDRPTVEDAQRWMKAAKEGRIPRRTADPFAEPVTFPSGVRWEPADYKPIDQTEYRRFAAERGPNSQ